MKIGIIKATNKDKALGTEDAAKNESGPQIETPAKEKNYLRAEDTTEDEKSTDSDYR